MRIGVTTYDMRADEFIHLARAVDEAGFDSLWTGEHVLLPVDYDTPHPTIEAAVKHTGPVISPDTNLVDPLVQLGAAAAVTSRVRLGTSIFVLPLRHPLAVARSVCTLQEVAGGRFTLGGSTPNSMRSRSRSASVWDASRRASRSFAPRCVAGR
jgi:alkanesulfonate monooxygenase SsuD/methylene tetrahydromethanopterin reductase-like flavin-dependent oxidoreductase (luciferase family)